MALAGMLAASCKKDTGVQSNTASLNIINASSAVPEAAINYSAAGFSYSQNKTFIGYQSALEFGLPTGSNPVNIISSADTTGSVFHGSLNLQLGGIYSLYLAGNSTKADTVFMKDNIPYYGADSVAGARFINLSPDSQPVSINLQGSATKEFSSLAYKKITAFKKYPATMAVINNGGYVYEVTDASGNVLTTFYWTPTVFKNNTLVISGSISDGSISVFPVNNY